MSTPQSWVDVARLRQGLYRFYSAALLEPTRGRAEALIASAAFFDSSGIEAFAYAMTWSRVKATLLSEQSLDSLRGEYVRLFASGVDGALSPPTESFYAGRADSGAVGSALASVESDYKALGVVPVSSSSAGPDHVSTQLEVVAFLCAREAAAWEQRDPVGVRRELTLEEGFLRSHLSWWLPQFRHRVRAAGAAPFYMAVVDGAEAAVKHDCAYVRALLGEKQAS